MKVLFPCALVLSSACLAQHPASKPLFDAPLPASPALQLAQAVPAPAGSHPNAPSTQPAPTPSPTGPRLTLMEAEKMALEHNPNISIARLLQLAQVQVAREVRSNELPTATGNLTAVGAHENSRLTAGALNNPIVYNRAAGGLRYAN